MQKVDRAAQCAGSARYDSIARGKEERPVQGEQSDGIDGDGYPRELPGCIVLASLTLDGHTARMRIGKCVCVGIQAWSVTRGSVEGACDRTVMHMHVGA